MFYQSLTLFLVNSIGRIGYLGIFILMFLESSFFPFPSEVVMIPAGYLAYKGEINLSFAILVGVLGSIGGAWFNYIIAKKFGREILLKLVSRKKLEKVELFFEKHGSISTFDGRLIPIVRQYISFPAGLAKMNAVKFTFYTALGSIIWTTILVFLGYYLGQNETLIHNYLRQLTFLIILGVFILTLIYIFYKKRKKELKIKT